MIVLENNQIVLKIDPAGGAYVDFHLKERPLNPINWVIKDESQPPFKGHFLCFDRWGPPTEAERSNGFVHHGEASTLQWELLNSPRACATRQGTMRCTLPMGRLELTRQISLMGEEPVFLVSEKIRNLNPYGRMFNIVQHVTIAPPFLDQSTLCDHNAVRGFENRENGSLHQEEPVLHWPEAMHDGKMVDLRRFQDPWPRVSSFVYDERDVYGWVTAANPALGLMLGYIWKISDYPWINFWRSMQDGKPVALGMEFGTTGLHEPFPVLARKGKIFERNLYDFIDAGETIDKTFLAFLTHIPGDYHGVNQIIFDNSGLVIVEKERRDRKIHYNHKIFPQ